MVILPNPAFLPTNQGQHPLKEVKKAVTPFLIRFSKDYTKDSSKLSLNKKNQH